MLQSNTTAFVVFFVFFSPWSATCSSEVVRVKNLRFFRGKGNVKQSKKVPEKFLKFLTVFHKKNKTVFFLRNSAFDVWRQVKTTLASEINLLEIQLCWTHVELSFVSSRPGAQNSVALTDFPEIIPEKSISFRFFLEFSQIFDFDVSYRVVLWKVYKKKWSVLYTKLLRSLRNNFRSFDVLEVTFVLDQLEFFFQRGSTVLDLLTTGA